MSITIHQLPFSPYCIPITAALEAFGVRFRTVDIRNHDRAGLIKLTGGRYYQVPVLVHDGEAVFESGQDTIDVARHVDRALAGGRLFPTALEGLQRILVPHLENEVELTTFKLVDPHRIAAITDLVERTETIRFKERRFGRGCLEQWRRDAPALRRRAETLLEPFDLMLRRSPFVLGEAPVYTDFALLGIVGNMTWGGYVKLPSRLEALAEWERRLRTWRFAPVVPARRTQEAS